MKGSMIIKTFPNLVTVTKVASVFKIGWKYAMPLSSHY